MRDLTALFDYASQPKVPTACNMCGTSPVLQLQNYDRYGYRVTYSTCRDCGLTYLQDRMTAKAYAGFYDGPYRALVSAFHNRVINAETVERDQVPYAIALGDLLAPYVLRNSFGRLIDVGGSTGVVAAHLCNLFHYRGTVVDVAEKELERASAKGLATILSSAENLTHPDVFDLALVCQTIDHVLDPLGLLIKLKWLLTKRGLLFVDILNYDAVKAFKIDHPFYFTPTTMQAMLWKAGFATCAPVPMADNHVGFIAVPMRRG